MIPSKTGDTPSLRLIIYRTKTKIITIGPWYSGDNQKASIINKNKRESLLFNRMSSNRLVSIKKKYDVQNLFAYIQSKTKFSTNNKRDI